MSDDQRKLTTKAPGLTLDAQNKIGQRLKAMYDDVVQQPVPDRFAQLLAELDNQRKPGNDTER